MRLQIFALVVLLTALTSGMAAGQSEQPITTTLELATDTGTVMVGIPEGWVTLVDSETGLTAANSADALDNSDDEPFAPDEVQIVIFTMRADAVIDVGELSEEDVVMAILKASLAMPEDTDAQTEPLLKIVNDVPVAIAHMETPESATYALVRMVSDQTFLMLQTITAPDELADWIDLTDHVFASIEAEEACGPIRQQDVNSDDEAPFADEIVLTETYTRDEIVFSINYPAGWAIRPSFPNGVDAGSSEEALDLWQPHDFAAGDMHASIGFGTALEMFEVTSAVPMSPVEIFAAVMALEGEDDLGVSPIWDATINGRPAACVTIEQPESATYILIVDYGDDAYLSASIQTAVDELATGAAILLAMVDSVEMKDPR